MPQQLISFQHFTPAGRTKAEELVDQINGSGGKARIGDTWLDYGAGQMWETVLVYSHTLQLWYQALNPSDFEAMNHGQPPPHYDHILKQSKH
jgi:hypothetical protein